MADRFTFEAFPRAFGEPGAKLYVYTAGSTEPINTYSDESGTFLHPVPVVADGAGYFPQIYIAERGIYKVRVTTASNVLIQEADFVNQGGDDPRERETAAAVIADASFGYTSGTIVIAGDYITTKQGYRYIVAASDASDHNVITTGGVKLYVAPDTDGYYPIEAFGVLGDGSDGDLARIQAAVDFSPFLRFLSKTYTINDVVDAPNDGGGNYTYKAYRKVGILLNSNKSVAWRTSGETVIRVSDELQGGSDANKITPFLMIGNGSFSAPGFVFDQNATAQDFAGPIGLYGLTLADLDRVTVRNYNAARFGASEIQLCQRVTGHMTAEDGVGTFSAGGKPGGSLEWDGFSLTVRRARGGLNIECEDVNGFGLTHQTLNAVIGTVAGFYMDGSGSPLEFVKIEDGVKSAQVDQISLINGAGDARQAALVIKNGQGDTAIGQASVKSIYGRGHGQSVYVEMQSDTNEIGDVSVGSIQMQNVGTGILARNTRGTDVIAAKSITVGSMQGIIQSPFTANAGTAILCDQGGTLTTGIAGACPPHLNYLKVGGGILESVRAGTFNITGVKTVVISDLTTDEQTLTGTGTVNVIEADHIILRNVVLRGISDNASVLELRPKVSCLIEGCEFTGNGAGSVIWLNGSGSTKLSNNLIAGGTNAINFRASDNTFDAATAVNTGADTITITSHRFRHGEQVRYTEGTGAIGGLTTATDYFVLYVDANTIQLSNTIRGNAINLTSAGTGTATLKKAHVVEHVGTRNLCTNLSNNTANALTYAESGDW